MLGFGFCFCCYSNWCWQRIHILFVSMSANEKCNFNFEPKKKERWKKLLPSIHAGWKLRGKRIRRRRWRWDGKNTVKSQKKISKKNIPFYWMHKYKRMFAGKMGKSHEYVNVWHGNQHITFTDACTHNQNRLESSRRPTIHHNSPLYISIFIKLKSLIENYRKICKKHFSIEIQMYTLLK